MTGIEFTGAFDAAAYDHAPYNSIIPAPKEVVTLLFAVRAILLADLTVYDLLGSTSMGDTEIKSVYPVQFPSGPIGLPGVVMTRISEPTDPINGARKTRVQLDCYATTYGIVQMLSVAVRNALESASWVDDTITILNATPVNSNDGYDTDKHLYQVIEEVSIVWRYTP